MLKSTVLKTGYPVNDVSSSLPQQVFFNWVSCSSYSPVKVVNPFACVDDLISNILPFTRISRFFFIQWIMGSARVIVCRGRPSSSLSFIIWRIRFSWTYIPSINIQGNRPMTRRERLMILLFFDAVMLHHHSMVIVFYALDYQSDIWLPWQWSHFLPMLPVYFFPHL